MSFHIVKGDLFEQSVDAIVVTASPQLKLEGVIGNKVKEICESWYNEKKNYIFGQIKYQKGTGHFTQMIWKGTKEVGFGWGTSKSNKFYFLAYYYPAGNEIGKFKENVLEDKSKKNAKEE